MIARSTLAVLVLVLGAASDPVQATDQPIAGSKLVVVRTSGGREKLLFVSRDPAFLFPVAGGADDPATGTPGGATIDLFSAAAGPAALSVPAGAGQPGWTVVAGTPGSFKFRNPLAPDGIASTRSMLLKQGTVLRLSARAAGLAPGPHGTVGIRITTGSLRSCALFGAATIRRDTADVFIARGAVTAGLADCSDAVLGDTSPACTDGTFPACDGTCPPGSACGTQDLSSCICISEAQPCGDTAPVCNGECPIGEECSPLGGFPLPSCGCLPTGSTACGTSQCGGSCPAAQECNFYERAFPGSSGCQCGPLGACGTGGDDCPPGFHCAIVPPSSALCIPNP